jgi:hypothetical protein
VAIAATPVVGQFWSAYEIALGKNLGGLGADMDATERVVTTALLLAPHARKILGAGAKGAATVVELARRCGKSPDEVISLLRRANALGNDAAALTQSTAKLKAGQALTTADEAALARAEAALNLKLRRYEPTVKGTSTMPAGEGATDKYGNIWYSTKGTAKQIGLAKNHETVHSVLSPKAEFLREFRADASMTLYERSCLLRAVEEAAAETYAQIKVNGLSAKSLGEGLMFPIREGYVRLLPTAANKQLGTPLRAGLIIEASIGAVVIGGVEYKAYVFGKEAIDEALRTKQAK